MEYDYDELYSVLDLLCVCSRMVEEGRWTNEDINWGMESDNYFHVSAEALWNCCESVDSYYSENTCNENIYFRDPCMLEYYRLCREYSRRRGIKLKDNPYMRKAEQYVRHWLSGDYHSDYILHTKVNHEGASGIHFMHTEEFQSEAALVTRLLNVFAFYRDGVAELKAELSKPTALAIVYPWPVLPSLLREAVAA